MPKRGKKYQEALTKVDRLRLYEPREALELLQEAGHGDGFEMTIHTLTNSPFPEIAQAVQADLAKAGIKAKIVTLEGKTLWPKYRAREHLWGFPKECR